MCKCPLKVRSQVKSKNHKSLPTSLSAASVCDCHCLALALPLPGLCLASASSVSCLCFAFDSPLPGLCLVFALLLPSLGLAFAWPWPRLCLAIARPLPCFCLAFPVLVYEYLRYSNLSTTGGFKACQKIFEIQTCLLCLGGDVRWDGPVLGGMCGEMDQIR